MSPEHLACLQELFQIGELNPITLRAIAPSTFNLHIRNLTFTASDFADVMTRWAAFAHEANRLNAEGYNIYTCLNPIRPEFDGAAVSDGDIECRRLLLIDLDRAETHDGPATDEEIHLASLTAEKIQTWMRKHHGDEAARVMSGNGIHLLYRLADLPNDEASKSACRDLLKNLGKEFNTKDIKVDTTVHNASRITKVPGTIARKGTEAPERPFRKAMFL